jgi:competence protein ComEC
VTRFVPWSQPAAAGVVGGIVLVDGAGAPASLVVAACLAAAAAALVATGGRDRSGAPLGRTGLLVLVACVALGAVRAGQAAAWRDPLAPLAGRTVELAGRSDGRLLHLSGLDARVVLRPVASVPRGEVRVRGRLREGRPARTPGGFDERGWARGRRASLVLEVDAVTAHRPEAGVRAALRTSLVAGLRPEAAQLMRAMVLGEREEAGELRERFARAGLAHLLALSGLHLGVVAGALAALLAPLGRWRGLVVAVAAAGIPLALGPTPSLVRAAIMTGVAAAAVALGSGRIAPTTTLAAAAAATLIARPDWLGDVGFQLSYLSLAGILAWGVPATRRLTAGRPAWHPRAWLIGGLAVSVAAWTAGLPVVASTFGSVAPAGPLVNLPALPLAAVLVPAGVVKAAAGAVWAPAGALTRLVVAPLAEATLAVASLGARLPQLAAPGVGPLGGALFAAATLPWAATLRRRLAPRHALRLVATSLAAWAWLPPAGATPELVILDVGQGDASLLRLPGRTEVLVDGGGTPFGDYDVGAEVVVPALRSLGVDAIELVVASHPDLDHAEGLIAVLRSFPVGALAYGHDAPGEPAWERLAAVARAEGVPLLPLRRGQALAFGQARLHVLHPVARPSGDPNDDSVVLRLDWRGRPWALLAGDVSERVEEGLAVPPLPLLLAPHHGSGGSTGRALLRAASPEVVAISVGRNRYGHPSPAVLARAAEAGAEVRRTDLDGTLRFRPAW